MSLNKFILVTYDIKDDKRRNRIAKTLLDYGNRVQYSVFECQLNEKRDREMRRRILKQVNEKEDSVRYYVLCPECKETIDIQGMGEVTDDPDFWII